MAILNPSIEIINNLHQKPESGEIEVLNKLLELDDEYEIYFQPYLNGDRPDLVLLRKGGGALIIEVKNWNLDYYSIDSNLKWRVEKNNALIRESPIDQVQRVQRNFIELHIKGLYQKAYKNAKLSSCIRTCIVFPKHTTSQVEKFIFHGDTQSVDKWNDWKIKNARYSNPIGIDSLEGVKLQKLLSDTWISKKSWSFMESVGELASGG